MGNFNKKNKAAVNIGVGADTTQIQTAMQSVAASIAALAPVMREFNKSQRTTTDAIEKTTVATKGFSNTASLAGMNIMNLANLVSDLPYGFRGIANNLSYAMQMMVMLNNETKSLKGTFVALKQSLMGSGGILIAFNLVIAAIDYFIGNGEKAKKKTKELTETVKDNHSEALILIERLRGVGLASEEQRKITKELHEEHGVLIGKYKTEEEKLIALKTAHEDVTKSMVAEANMSVLMGKMKASASQILDYEAELTRLKSALKTNQDLIEEMKSKDQDLTIINQAQWKIIDDIRKVEEKISWEKEKQRRIGAKANELSKDIINVDKDKKKENDSDDKKDNWLREQEEINRLLEQENEIRIIESSNADKEILENKKKADLEYFKWYRSLEQQIFFGEIEITGEIFPKNQKEKLKNEIKEFGEEINALLEQYVVSAIVSLGEMIGEAMVLGKDAFGSNKDQMLESFADFLSKLGGMMIAFGITLKAFDESLKKGDGTVAIAAGIAAVIAAGAIKGYLKRKGDTALTGGGGGGGSSYSGANGYGGDGGDIVIYTRLDGRDLVMSGSRYQYVGRR